MTDPDDGWAVAAARLRSGVPLAEACANLPAHHAAWVLERWSGSLVDLVEVAPGASVLIVREVPGGELAHAVAAGANVRLRSGAASHQEFVEAWLPKAEQASPPWDLVVLGDGVRWGSQSFRSELREIVADLSPGGQVMAVADNAYNPLRALDRRVGKSASRAASRLGRVVADLRAAGLVVHQRFGVARSTLAPTTVFDLDAPVAGAAALQRVTPLMAGPRRAMTAGLAHLVGRGIGGPAAPGWMVLAGVGPAPNDPLRITGRIASLDSDESKMILGEPPEIFEKRYSDLAAADASAMALNTLHEHAPGLAPTPLGRSHPMRVRTAWISGRPLSPHGLNAAEIETWVEKAAEALRRMQDHTRRPDGSVLVHGDYWLGNLVVDDDRILAVIDWAGAHWGDPSEDREHLVASFLELGVTGEATADSLRLIVDGVFATQL